MTERGGTPPTTDELSLSAPVATPPSPDVRNLCLVLCVARVDTINIFARYLGGVRALCVTRVMCLCDYCIDLSSTTVIGVHGPKVRNMKPRSEMLLEVTVYCGKVRDQRGCLIATEHSL